MTIYSHTARFDSAHVLRFGDSNGETNTPIKPEQLLTPRRTKSRAVNGIDQDIKLNKALWIIGQAMAAGKA